MPDPRHEPPDDPPAPAVPDSDARPDEPAVDLRLGPRDITRLLVALGAVACLLRFGLRSPIWPDEAYVAINVVCRDLAGMLGPLDYHQVAPPLFLLVQWTVVELAGFTEWSVRAVPLAAVVGALVAFRSLAHRVLGGWSAIAAVAVFASTYWFVRHGSEAKPYTVDLLLSATILLLTVRWRDDRSLGSTIALALLAAIAFAASFPAVFVGGGAVCCMIVVAAGERSGRRLVEALLVGACLVGGFVAVYALHASAVLASEGDWMRDYWERSFPPLPDVGASLVWLGARLTGEAMPYPVGGKYFASIGTTILVLIGLVATIRERRWPLVVLLSVPVGLSLVAAILGRYPFGAPTRCQLHLAPIFILLAGRGIGVLLTTGAAGRPELIARRGRVVLIACGLLIGVTMTRDVLRPAKTRSDLLVRDLARVLWHGSATTGLPVLTIRGDFDTSFTPASDDQQTLVPVLLANQRLYGDAEPVDWRSVDLSGGAIVLNHRFQGKVNERRRAAWLERFQHERGLRLAGSVLLPLPDVDNDDRIRSIDRIELMRFESARSDDP